VTTTISEDPLPALRLLVLCDPMELVLFLCGRLILTPSRNPRKHNLHVFRVNAKICKNWVIAAHAALLP
jgi:hypothetical protein